MYLRRNIFVYKFHVRLRRILFFERLRDWDDGELMWFTAAYTCKKLNGHNDIIGLRGLNFINAFKNQLLFKMTAATLASFCFAFLQIDIYPYFITHDAIVQIK